MFSNLKQIFNTQSPHYKLAIVSTVAAAIMMSLLCMMALKANARMFSKFSKDLVRYIAADLTQEIENSMNLSTQAVVTFADFDNTSSKISKKTRNEMYVEFLAKSLRRVSDDVGVSRYYYASTTGEMVMVELSDKKNEFRVIESAVKPKYEQNYYLIDSDSFELKEKEAVQKKQYDPRKRSWYQAVIKNAKISWSNPYEDYFTGVPTITLSYARRDKAGKLVGVFAMDIDLDKFLTILLKKINISMGGIVYIVKEDGTLLAGSQKEKLFSDENDNYRSKKIWESDVKVVQSLENEYLEFQAAKDKNYEKKEGSMLRRDGLWFYEINPISVLGRVDFAAIVAVPMDGLPNYQKDFHLQLLFILVICVGVLALFNVLYTRNLE